MTSYAQEKWLGRRIIEVLEKIAIELDEQGVPDTDRSVSCPHALEACAVTAGWYYLGMALHFCSRCQSAMRLQALDPS